MNRTSDPIDGLLNSFAQFDPFHDDDTPRTEDSRLLLHNMRTFTYANTWCILDAADLVKRYVHGLGPKDEEGQKRRADKVIEVLLAAGRMKVENSRVLVYVVKEAIQEVHFCNKKLADYFGKTVVKQIYTVFCRLWRDAARVSPQIEQRNSLIDISNLRFITVFLGDLYAAEVLPEAEFLDAVQMMFQLSTGPTLFHIFLYDFIARALTCSSKKLSPMYWRDISERWVSMGGSPHGFTGAVVSIFHRDAMLPAAHCAIEWEVEYVDEMERLCAEIAAQFRAGMWEEEEERVGMEWEEERVTEALGGVGLECEVDGLLRSFQGASL